MKPHLAFFALAVFLSSTGLRAKDAGTLADGISLSVGGQTIELRVASPHAFRLHAFSPSPVALAPPIFLSDKTQPTTAFTQMNEGGAVGIKTAFGSLLVDPDKKMWMLRDAEGKTLADWATLPDASAAAGGQLALSAGSSSDVPQPVYYGSGSMPNRGSLTQNLGNSTMGNGRVSLPQYWSTARYGALMISGSENDPATWKANAAGGVDWTVPGNYVDH
jgi:hypothetical protein